MGDTGAIELSQAACAGAQDLLACGTGARLPVRAAEARRPGRQLPGRRRERQQAKATKITAFVRPAVAPTLSPSPTHAPTPSTSRRRRLLPGHDRATPRPTINAGCDQGGVPQGGAPEQLLRLTLALQKRVVLDMAGSGYTTLLDVRKGPTARARRCRSDARSASSPDRSFLDLTLDAGTYYIQVDGFALDKGPGSSTCGSWIRDAARPYAAPRWNRCPAGRGRLRVRPVPAASGAWLQRAGADAGGGDDPLTERQPGWPPAVRRGRRVVGRRG